ncbi:MAG: RHS repeat-associated core domain-containing protein [Caldilineaceae bacterium]
MAYTINGTTETGEVRYYPWGKDRAQGAPASGTTPTSYKFTGQREEASLGLYYYGARWYDPALGRFIGSPLGADTIVPNPGDMQSFDHVVGAKRHRYAYVNNNPLKYVDPTGHEPCPSGNWGDCRPQLGKLESNRLAQHYHDLGVSWTAVPGDAKAVLTAQGETEGSYSDLGPGATVQTGWRDPATVAASAVVGGWMVWRLPALLAQGAAAACADGDCENEYRVYEMAAKRVNSIVSFQRLGGFSRDVLTKGYHLNSEVGEVSLIPQRLANGSIQIAVNQAGSTTGAITNSIVQGVAALLQSDPTGALQRAQGIISTFGNDPRYVERVQQAQLLVEAITSGKYTVVK